MDPWKRGFPLETTICGAMLILETVYVKITIFKALSLFPLVQDYLNKHVQMMQSLPFFVAAIWWHYSQRSILTIV